MSNGSIRAHSAIASNKGQQPAVHSQRPMNPPNSRAMNRANGYWLYLIATVISIALFATALYVDDVINDDGIEYIFAAFEYSKGNTAAALSFRPEQLFYSQIGILSKSTGLTLLQSAYTLSLLAQIALMCGFLAVTRSLGGSATVQLLAIMVIASMVNFNDLRPHIIKGFGFWSAQIWALWAIIRFSQDSRWRHLFCWVALSGISISFRIEGIAYLVGMTLLIPLIVKANARKRFLLCGLIILAAALTIGSLNHLYSDKTDKQQASLSMRFDAELLRAKHIAQSLDKQKELIRDTMPNRWARDSASQFLIGGLLFEVLKVLVYTTNGLLLVLALWYGKPSLLPRTIDHKLIASYFTIGLIISFYTVASRFFVTDRYLFLPALLLCLPIPFLLNNILLKQSGQGWNKRYILCGAIFIIPLLAILAPVIKDSDDKMYIPHAVQWLNKHASRSEKTYYNDKKLAFYSGDYANRSFEMKDISIEKLQRDGYRYAVILSKQSRPVKTGSQFTGTTGANNDRVQLLHSTMSKRKGRVDVYKITEPAD